MSWDSIEVDWAQFSGQLKEKWGGLTEEDMSTIRKKLELLDKEIQTLHGHIRDFSEVDHEIFATPCSAVTHLPPGNRPRMARIHE